MRTPALLSAAAALLLAAPAFAQDAAPVAGPATSAPHAGRMGHGGPGHDDWRARFAAMRQQRMQDLHTVLRIRPDQEAAWQAYQAALAPPEHAPHGPHADKGAAATAPETTPQALDHLAAWQAKREQRMAARAEAVKRFYAALSPEQQQVFDALRRLSHHGGGRFGGHGFGGRRGGGFERG